MKCTATYAFKKVTTMSGEMIFSGKLSLEKVPQEFTGFFKHVQSKSKASSELILSDNINLSQQVTSYHKHKI